MSGLKPFAAINITTGNNVLITELAKRGVVVLGGGSVPVKLSLELAPYVWGTNVQSDEQVELNAASYAGKRLLNRNARWAGQIDYQAQGRKFALIHPDTWDMKIFNDMQNWSKQILEQAGAEILSVSDKPMKAPVWFKLARHGGRIYAYLSSDGKDWDLSGAEKFHTKTPPFR